MGFIGRVKIVSHSSCRTSPILKYFCPLKGKNMAYLLSVLSTVLLTSLRYLERVSSKVDRRLLSFGKSCAALDTLVRWSNQADTKSFCTSCKQIA